MILTLNTDFEGYTPMELLSAGGSYREVYHAKDCYEKDVALVVYDLDAMPDAFVDKKVPEFEIVPQLSNEMFLKCIEQGKCYNGNIAVSWMAKKYAGHNTLRNYIESNSVRDERDMLSHFYKLLVAVCEFSWRMNGSCHHNISIDNIIVSNDDKGGVVWYLEGLNCVSMPSKGRPKFDTSMVDRAFHAPETIIGTYNSRTDIFSLGIVLAYLLQGKHPWESCIYDGIVENPAKWVRAVRVTPPVLEVPEPLKNIVAKAIAVKPSMRYKSVVDFADDIAKYLGISRANGIERFEESPSKHVVKPSEDELSEDTLSDENTQHLLPQPKCAVRIERVVGDGFKGVAGMKQLKNMLTRNFIDIVKNRELAKQFQITPPNGILLWGPPGTGKTFISKKLAEESGMLFSLVKPSDLGNIYIHGSQGMIADLFTRSEALAKKNNCGVLLVFDEFDSIVPKRDGCNDNNQANEVAEFLTRLNDCAEKNIFVVATTNRIDAIDTAIIRRGRMDEIVYVGMPDEDARKELLEIELLKRPHEIIDIDSVVKLTNGYSSSDISFIVKECARCSFEESIQAKHLIKINQMLLEKTIATTKPSVSSDELKKYESKRDFICNGRKHERPRVGFHCV